MKEIQSIVNAYGATDFSVSRAALATVSRVEGSSYRRAGAHMLVLDNGIYFGGISGGCLEGDALRRSQKAIVQHKSSLVTYDTTQDDGYQIGVGLGCKGIIDVLFTPLDPKDEQNQVRILSGIMETREPRALAWITECDEKLNALGKLVLYDNDEQFLTFFPIPNIARSILPDIANSLESKISQTITYHSGDFPVTVFIEMILPVTHLVMYGIHDDMQTLARIANELGWKVTIVTNLVKISRSVFSSASRVLEINGIVEPETDPYTAIVVMSHDYKTDLNNFISSLGTNSSYIGLLGPRKRSEKFFEELEYRGTPVSEKDRKRIFAPAGLDIGATAPEEIALSIVAEICSQFAGTNGMSLKYKEGAIHAV